MKNVARLILFFSVSFIVAFLFAALCRSLVALSVSVQSVPVSRQSFLGECVRSLPHTLPIAFYISLFAGFQFVVLHSINGISSFLCLLILSTLYSTGAAWGISTFFLPSSNNKEIRFEYPGTVFVDSTIIRAAFNDYAPWIQVAVDRSRSFEYRQELPKPLDVTFQIDGLHDISGDMDRVALQIGRYRRAGLVFLAGYFGALSFFLLSLAFAFRIRKWPMATLVLSAAGFRGVLILEGVILSEKVQKVLNPVLQNRVPELFRVLLIFCGLGILIMLYVFFVNIGRGKESNTHTRKRVHS